MNNVKYRAWDNRDKIMWMPITLEELILSNWELTSIDGESSLPYSDYVRFAHKDTIWMICTGAPDKHGVEICEGDLVNQDDSVYQIKRGEGGIYCHEVDGDEYLFRQLEEQRCEVIGNIYQNPELVTE